MEDAYRWADLRGGNDGIDQRKLNVQIVFKCCGTALGNGDPLLLLYAGLFRRWIFCAGWVRFSADKFWKCFVDRRWTFAGKILKHDRFGAFEAVVCGSAQHAIYWTFPIRAGRQLSNGE